MFKEKALISLFAAAALAGCGGSEQPVESLETMMTRSLALIEEAETLLEAEGVTRVSEVPLSGSVTYQGYFAGETVLSETALLGQSTATANFGSNTITGSIYNLYDSDDFIYDGNLTLTNGSITRDTDLDAVGVDAIVGGTLTDQFGDRYTIDGVFVGGFGGDDYDFLGGEVAGDIEYNGDYLDSYEGAIILKR